MEFLREFDKRWAGFFGPQHPLSQKLPAVVPHYALVAMMGYLAFVAVVPGILSTSGMKFKLKTVMRLYNAFMVALSTYMGTSALVLAFQANDTVWCVPLATGAAGDAMARMVWIFTYSKIIEFLDTVFMVLEGRLRQVSFLHVYHHVSILLYWYAILWKAPGSDAYFSLAINSYIHVIMYGYYLLASFGYSPWWKYYVTYSQIIQFISFAIQSVYVGFIRTEKHCGFPDLLSRGLAFYMATLIVLFGHFLIVNKFRKKSSPSVKKDQ